MTTASTSLSGANYEESSGPIEVEASIRAFLKPEGVANIKLEFYDGACGAGATQMAGPARLA